MTMGRKNRRRWLAATGVIGAIALMTATPAAAAPTPALELFTDRTLIPSEAPLEVGSIALTNEGPARELNNVVVTVDLAGMAGLATVEGSATANNTRCTPVGTVLTCNLGTVRVEQTYVFSLLFLYFTPTDRTLGRKGSYKVKVESAGNAPITGSGSVEIAEGVNLSVGKGPTVSGAPGDRVDLPLTVSNLSKVPAKSTVLLYDQPFDYTDSPKRFSNCQYGFIVACRFDSTLQPGKEYGLAQPLPVRIRPDSTAPHAGPEGRLQSEVRWETVDDAEFVLGLLDKSKAPFGTDGELTLVEKQQPKLRAFAQTDVNILDNWTLSYIEVTGPHRAADQAAVGATVTGPVGSTVSAHVGARALGPARVTFMDGSVITRVKFPAGTTVVRTPQACIPAGLAEFVCFTPTIDANQTFTWDFGLRLDTVGQATGTVTVQTDTFGKEALDTNKENDTAPITVTTVAAPPSSGRGAGGGTGAGAGGSADGSTGAGAGGSADGGSLPVTGADAGVAAAAGAALIALGAGGYLMARRRRTRFTA